MTPPPGERREPRQPPVRGDVAIIGMACTFPGARNLSEFWSNIVRGIDCVTEVPHQRWDPDVFYDPDPSAEDRVYCKRGGYLGTSFAFNPLRYGTMPKAVVGAEPDQFLVLRTVHEAMEDADYLDRDLNGQRASFILGRGCYLGAGLAGLLQRGLLTEQTLDILRTVEPGLTPAQLDAIKRSMQAGVPRYGAETAPGLIPNITTGRVANRLDLMGPTFTVDAACASSLIATELAVRDLLAGLSDLVLVGGVHVFSDVPFLQVFTAMGALSRSETIRPFDRDCDGIVSGEGVGILVLKRLGDANADGDRIYAVIKGIGSSSDGRATSVAAPRVEGEELALRRAYEISGIDPETIGLIEAHGTATPVGDSAEIEALHRVFGLRKDGPPTCALGSVKSMIGHAMPAAGAAGLIKTVLALYHGALPPTLNCRRPLEAIYQPGSRFYVNTRTRPWIHARSDTPRRAGVSAFGFGGVNAHVVLEEYRPARPGALFPEDDSRDTERLAAGPTIELGDRPALVSDWDTEVCVLEAETEQALADAASRLCSYANAVGGVSLCDIAYTCNTSLGAGAFRIAIVASSIADLAEKLSHATTRLRDPDCHQIKDTKGIYYFGDSPVRGGKVAFLFPGEGAQYVNMLSDLCLHFPEVRACFEAADRAVNRPDRYPPSADIFPPPFFDEQEKEAAEARLWRIERATEAVLTADGALFLLLRRLGLRADMLAGHSAGEWIALAAAGVVGIEEFVASMDRLDAMYRDLAEDATIEQMVMLAVGAGRDRINALASEIDRTVHIANDNCPHQVVIVVAPEDAGPVTRHLRSGGIFVEKLPYDRGYHTPLFTYICEPLRQYFGSLDVQPADTALYSCTTAKPYPVRRDQILDLVSNTFARPLLFRDTIEAMYEAGSRVFVEVGPRGNLTSFVDDILRGRPHVGIAIDRPRRSGTSSLNHALGQLAALHVPMDLSYLYARRSPRKLSFDADADRLPDPDSAPGTMQVSLCYPRLTLDESPVALAGQPEAGSGRQATGDDGSPRLKPEARSDADARPAPSSPAIEHERREESEVRQRSSPPPPPKEVGRPASRAGRATTSGAMREHLRMMEAFLKTQEEVMQAYMGIGLGAFAAGEDTGVAVRTEPIARPAAGAMVTSRGLEPATQAGGQSAPPPPADATPVANTGDTPTPATDQVTDHDKASSPQRLEDRLISIVSDKTGYPPEMLDLDLDMEADLGIDSIKRIEILGSLQETAGDALATGEIDMEQVARLKTLREVLGFLQGVDGAGSGETVTTRELKPAAQEGVASTPDASRIAFSGEVVRFTPGSQVVVVRTIDIEEDLYLRDHCLDPPASEVQERCGKLPVVPLTVSLEMMAEAANLLMPERKVVKARAVRAGRWIDLEPDKPKVSIAITATSGKSADEIDVAIRLCEKAYDSDLPTGPPVAECTIVLADSFPPAPPLPDAPLENSRTPSHTAEQMYAQRRMFHGPSFQGVASLDAVGEDGLLAQLKVLPREGLFRSNASPRFHIDPFLLDAAGQLVGYWPVEYLSEGFVLFPIRIAELELYRESLPPGARALCRLSIREVSQRQLRADMDIVGADGELWMRVIGWEDWRFYWSPGFYDFWRFPDKGTLSERLVLPLPDGCEDIECRRVTPTEELSSHIWRNLWIQVVLGPTEREQYHALASDARRQEWLHGRAAAKDAVRMWVKRHHGVDLYPADVEIINDQEGKPVVTGPWVDRLGGAPQVSISHKNMVAVAAAGRGALGIDLERIRSREAGFESVAFNEREREILARMNGEKRDEWITRAWCAKEAASKAMGLGLSKGPSTMVVESIEDDHGAMIVTSGEVLRAARPGLDDRPLVVHSVRDGDYVIALAIGEGNGYGGV